MNESSGEHVQTFGRFEVLEPMHSDAHQSEYVGRDTQNGNKVIVKVFHRDPDEDYHFRKYHRRVLENQQEVSNKLNHSGVLKVLAISEINEPEFIVTEHIDNLIPLTQLIANRDQLGLPRALQIACAIATVIDHAHRNNIVHCDLQPRNILVARDDSVKVTGFALATQLDHDD